MTSLPYQIQNISKSDTRQFLHNNFTEIDYDEDVIEHVLKIDSNDRNIDKYKDPFSFRVRFNQTESNFDSFGNAGPIILSNYQNIKYIKLVEAIIPRRNIVQEYNGYNKTLYENSTVHNYSVIQIRQDAAATQKKLSLKLGDGDTIRLGLTDIYTVKSHTTIDGKDYLNIYDKWGPAGAEDLFYNKVKLLGTVTGIKGETTITGTNTEFLKLENTIYKVQIKSHSTQYTVNANPANNYNLVVTPALTEDFTESEIYVVDSRARDDGKSVNLDGIENGTNKSYLWLQQNKNLKNDIKEIEENDIILFNDIDGEGAGLASNVYEDSDRIVLKKVLNKPINVQKSMVLHQTYFDKIPGHIYFDKTKKKITGYNVNFELYQKGSIIYLSDDNFIDSTIATKIAVDEDATTFNVDDNAATPFPAGSSVYLLDGTFVGIVTTSTNAGDPSVITMENGVQTDAITAATDLYKSNKYVILKINKIVSNTEIEVKILCDDGLPTGTETGPDPTDISTQKIYNYSYTRSSEEFSDERFILANVKEFGNDTFEGTNEQASKAFGILFPSGTTDSHAYMSGLSSKLYNRRNLQNLNSLTISFNDSFRNKLKLDNLDSTVDITDIRHPLHKDNQVHLTFRIGVVENRFD